MFCSSFFVTLPLKWEPSGKALGTTAGGKALGTTAGGKMLGTTEKEKNMQRKDERKNRPLRQETKHNQHRRAFSHDYREKGTYMVTIVVAGRKRVFGNIEGFAKGKPGTSEAPHMVLSELGRRVMEEETQKISSFYPMVEVWRVAMMPDHIHLLIRVKETLPEGKHLGTIVRGFKTGCTRAWWRINPSGKTLGTTADGKALGTTAGGKALGTMADVPEGSPSGVRDKSEGLRPVLFEAGYHDRIINRAGMLENIKRYMAENPLRARIRQECPKLMERQLHLWIAGREYAAFGNLFLLKYPLKEQVFFHRRDAMTGQPTETTEAYQKERARLLQLGEEGTVLVTPGISKGESLVVRDALDARHPLIILQKEPIGEYWKPSQQRFYACAAGHLLILAPWDIDEEAQRKFAGHGSWQRSAEHEGEGVSDYARFHYLNDLTKEVCRAMEMRILNYNELQA